MEDEKQITSFNEIVEAEEKQVSQSPTSNEPIEQFNIEAVLQEISGLFQELYHANQTLASKLTNTKKILMTLMAVCAVYHHILMKMVGEQDVWKKDTIFRY